jgi:ABC-type transport system involved in multi-copper enzyme maturation permease subunit
MRWGPGPVFIYECLANSRRWQTYALRAAGVAGLLCVMASIASQVPATANSWNDYAELGQGYFTAMIGLEIALVLLAAPAATAGAICLDRARGTLAHMLMTDLSDAEIVFGKLAARLLPVLGLVACTWPVMAISSLLGGIDPIALTLAFCVIVAVAIFACATAILLSVWARQSYEVILATYTVFILGMLFCPIWSVFAMAGWAGPPPSWALLTNPFYVANAPYIDPGTLDVGDYLMFFGTTLGASAVLTAIAVWRMRSVACRSSTEKSRWPRGGWIRRALQRLPGPSLDRNPVLWREWHRSRPTLWTLAILVLLMGTTFALCVGGAVALWIDGLNINVAPPGAWVIIGVCSCVLHVIFGLLMLAAIAPTSMGEERQRGSLDLLAATALSTRAIVTGKWLGTFRWVWPMTIGPGLMALALATARANGSPAIVINSATAQAVASSVAAQSYGVALVIATILAHGALITSIGLALAVWMKRHGRAIAMSVTAFILLTAAWPIVVAIAFGDEEHPARDLACLSPVVAHGLLMLQLTTRLGNPDLFDDMLYLGTFWAVEVFVVAMGLLWLTVRTFDACFERRSERLQQNSLCLVATIILIAMIGAGCLVGTIDFGIVGVKPGIARPPIVGIMAFAAMLAGGLVLIGAESARSGRPTTSDLAAVRRNVAVRKFVLDRWWLSFRLVLLLTVGPAIFALTVATTHWAWQYQPQVLQNSSGTYFISSFTVIKHHVPFMGELTLGQRLKAAALLIATILIHGGAAVSVGLAMAMVTKWSRRTVIATVGLAFSFMVLPIHLLYLERPVVYAGWSFVIAVYWLLTVLVTRGSFSFDETVVLIAAWDFAIALFAIGVSWCTIRHWRRQSIGASRARPSLRTVLGEEQPIAEASLVRD